MGVGYFDKTALYYTTLLLIIQNKFHTHPSLKMLNKKPSPSLKLNSYKIDPESLQHSLQSLTSMKQQLQTTISHYKSQQDHLLLQNERLKQQIQLLQNKSQQKIDVSGYQTKILKLEAELKEQKRETEREKKLREGEARGKEILRKEFQGKLEQQMSQSRIQLENYQQRVAKLEVQLKEAQYMLELNKREQVAKKEVMVSSSKGLYSSQDRRNTEMNMRSDSQPQSLPLLNSNNEKISQHSQHSQHSSSSQLSQPNLKKQANPIKQPQAPKPQPSTKPTQSNFPPKSPTSVSNFNNVPRQYKTSGDLAERKVEPHYSYSASYVPNQEDQEIFSGSIRKLYHEIKEMGLSSHQISALPQFKKMSNNPNPSHKDLLTFLKNPPIESQNDVHTQKNATLLQTLIRQKHGKLSGNHITELIIARVQEYENSSKLVTEDLQISEATPSIGRESSSYERASNRSEQPYRGMGYEQYINGSRPSIQDNLRIQSEASLF